MEFNQLLKIVAAGLVGVSTAFAQTGGSLRLTGTLAGPRTVTVTTTNNVNPNVGEVSLLQALQNLQDGDTINFNIPGPGPYYILTPSGGYPMITKTNATINGYSQPGATPNTNPILAANNAKIKVVLDSRNGNGTSMAYEPNNPNSGYGADELAILGVFRGENFHVQGLCFLGSFSAQIYCVAFATDYVGTSNGGHISGCWMGVDLDATSVFGTAAAVVASRHRDANQQNQVTTDNLTVGVKPGATNAVAQFNVILGMVEAIGIEANGTRISGNFIGVFPDGLHDYNGAFANIPNVTFDETHIEIGRANNNTVIGTDGDGINDDNERNIIGGVVPESVGTSGGYDHTIEFYGNNPGTNIVIAGNYFGVGIDGQTQFTNGVPPVNGSSSQFRFGSNFDGVSDASEANMVFNNYPPELFPASGFSGSEGFFDELGVGGIVSARGNALVNNFPFPISPLKNAGADLTNFYSKALVDVTNGIAPTLSTNTSISRIVGTVPLADTNNWPTTIIDLYAVDQVGLTNGQAIGVAELPNGFVQGAAYVGSFTDNGPSDRDNKLGSFDFDISTLDTKGSLVTVTANYVNTNKSIVLTSPFSDPAEVMFIPGSIESVGLRRVTPDTVLLNPGADALGNWEPYASVLGDSTFLIEGNTFAEGSTDNQRFVVYLQPAAGGQGKLGEAFFADNGQPFRDQINASRQNGNPGRVAGDKRPGAVNFIAGGEASPHVYPAFQSDNRWNLGFDRLVDGRYGTIQIYKLDPATLTQTPLSKALDSANGRLTTGDPQGNNQITRFGGELAGLDNGNFVSVVEDRSKVRNPDGDAVVATIFAPDGSVVKESFVVANGDIWSNAAAYQGGFAVRASGIIYFYDNSGNLKGQVDQSTSGETFDAGRGDGTRIAAHINSPYVYLIGKVTTANLVRVAVWDSRDQSFQAKADVSEGAFTGGFDRANMDVDALNRIAAAWVSQPAGYEQQQVAARVLAFDPGTKSITSLTKSFFPFVNAAATGGIHTFQMSVAMTTRQVMIAAKGEINLGNNPSAGVNSPKEVNFFTIFTHPDPKDDPTTPVGGQPPAGLTLTSIASTTNAVSLSWSGGTAPYLVQMKASLSDTNWFNVLTTSAQSATVAKVGGAAFFRVADHATTVVIPLTAQLSGAGEVPAVTTAGSGLGAFSLEGDTLTYLISFSGLSGNATASHIHGPSEVTGTAGVIIPFTVSPTPSGIISGSVTVTPDQKTNLLSGKTYANIHTAAHGGGEIRGQVNLAQFTAKLSGSAEVPAVTTAATGDGVFALIGDQLFYNISFTGLSGNATASHIHGPADISGSAPVIIPFTVGASTSGTISGTVTVTADQLANLVSGKTYANIHTAAHGGGEIRGQIVTLLLKATLSGSAEVPAVIATGSATGVFALTGNQLNYTINYSGLSGDATASHIHGPADVTGTAPVIIPFTVGAGTSGTIAGTVAVTSDQFTYLLTGRTYANIHTAANPGGEIRGQITP